MDPHIRLPSIDGLRAFEAAARLGSFERASEVLNITASAVSKRITTVEELLGTALLIRGAKLLVLTTDGSEYLAQVRVALSLLAAAPLHQRTSQRRQRLRVMAPPTFARQILVPHLESFTSAHPDVDLEVMLSIPHLPTSRADVDVEVRHGNNTDLDGMPLMRDVVIPVAAPALLARLPAIRMPIDLTHAPLLRTPLEPWLPWFRAAGLPWDEPSRGPKLLDLRLTLESAVSGQGVALARPSLARPWLSRGSLRPLFAITAEPSRSYCLLSHHQEGAALDFGNWLQQLCQSVAEEALRETLAMLSDLA